MCANPKGKGLRNLEMRGSCFFITLWLISPSSTVDFFFFFNESGQGRDSSRTASGPAANTTVQDIVNL